MQEILFRGKAINRDIWAHFKTNYKNGDWVYGLLTKKFDECFENLPAEMTNEDGISGIDVDYKTIGRYAGLKDINDNKIFESDIIVVTDAFDNKVTYVVEYKRTAFCASQLGINFSTYLGDLDNGKYEIEVIGNIYDNPELLENGKNKIDNKLNSNNIFDKHIIIDEEAAKNILNANEVSASELKNADMNKITDTNELVKWLKRGK